MMQWSQFKEHPLYKNADPEHQARMRDAYFDDNFASIAQKRGDDVEQARAQFHANNTTPEKKTGFFENASRGFGQAANIAVGDAISFGGSLLNDAALSVAEKIAKDQGKLEDFQKAKEGFDKEGYINPVQQFGNEMSEETWGYEPRYTFDEFLENPGLKTGAGFIAETGFQAVPHMVGAVKTPLLYLASMDERIAKVRAENKGMKNPTHQERLEAFPWALGSFAMDRIGAKGVLDDAAVHSLKDVGKETGKASLKEGGTEFFQEQAEYGGETVGTNKPWDYRESLKQGFAGAFAGAGMGGAIRGTTATADLMFPSQVNSSQVDSVPSESDVFASTPLDTESGSTNLPSEKLTNDWGDGTKLPSTIYTQNDMIQPTPLKGEVFNEMSPDALGYVLNNVFTNNIEQGAVFAGGGLFVSDDKSLAIGQGDNKGVEVEFNGALVSGSEHEKPATGIVGGREYQLDYINRNAIDEVRVPENAALHPRAERLLGEHFEKSGNENGKDIYTKKTVENSGAATEGDRQALLPYNEQLGYQHEENILQSRLEQWRSTFDSDDGGILGLVQRESSQSSLYSDKPRPAGSFLNEKSSTETNRAEANRLIAKAKEDGFFWDSSKVKQISGVLLGHEAEGQGAEHDVYIVGEAPNQVVIRNTANGNYGPTTDTSPAQYLQRLEEYNQTFPDLQIRLIGVSGRDGNAAIWTAQKFVEGKEYTKEADLQKAMEAHGWTRDAIHAFKYTHNESGAVIDDAHTGNVLYIGDELFPIDVVVEKLPKSSVDTKDSDTSYSGDTSMAMPGHVPGLAQSKLPQKPRQVQLADGVVSRKANPKKPVRYADVARKAVDIMGNRLYHGKIKSKKKLGFYRRSNSELRLKGKNDPETLAHEMAHFLDFHSKFNARFRNSYEGNKEVRNLSYTSDPGKVDKEGFAEFVRLWATQYDQAKKSAPNYVQTFEKILKEDPKLWVQMKKFQELGHSYYNQGVDARMSAKIGEDLSLSDKVSDFFASRPADMARQKTQDSIHAAKVINRVLNGDKADTLQGADNVYNLFQIARGGAEAIYKYIFDYHTIRLNESGEFVPTGEGLKSVLEPVTKQGVEVFDQLMLYFAARRASELMYQGRERNFRQDEISYGLSLATKHPEFEQVFERYQAFNNRMLDFYVDMALITPDQRTSFKEMNENYVPFHGIREALVNQKNGKPAIGARLKGGTGNVRDIAENITEGLESNIRAALEARAKSNLFKLIRDSEDGALFATKIPPDPKITKVVDTEYAKNIAKVLAELKIGVSNDGRIVANPDASTIVDVESIKNALENNPALLTMFAGMATPRTDETMVEKVIIDGEQVYFEVKEPLLIDMLQNLGGRTWGPIMRGLFAVRNLQTRTVTSMLQFLGGNLVSDTESAFLLSKNGFKPVASSLVGMYHYFRKDETYQKAMMHGLGYSSRIHAATEGTRSRRQLDLPSRGFLDAAAKALAAYDSFVSAFEYGSRIGEFKLAQEKGKDALQSSIEGRNISTDFTAHGSDPFFQGFFRTVPFMNAGMLGIVRTAKGMKEEVREWRGVKEDPSKLLEFEFYSRSLAAKGLAITAGSLLLAAANEDDPRWHDLTSDQKARYWWIFYDKDSAPLKIKKPYDLGHIFASMPEAAFEYTRRKEGDDFAKAMAFVVTDMLGFMNIPGAIQPIYEDLKNEKFTGAPIVPAHLEKMKGEQAYLQFTNQQPNIYRLAGKKFDVSPMRLEHYAKGYFRYLEAFVVDMSEAMTWDKEAFGERPFARNPLNHMMHHFVGRDVESRTKYIEQYHELKAQALSVSAGQSKLKSDARIFGFDESAPEFRGDNVALSKMNKVFSALDNLMSATYEASLVIKYDSSKTAEQKEKEINALYKSRNSQFADAVHQIKQELKKYKQEKP